MTDQTRSIDSHEIQCEKEYESDLRANTGTLFFPDKNSISTIDHGEQIDHRHTGKGKSKHTDKGKGKHVDVVETNQPSETASAMLAIEGGDADENMNMVKPGTEAWRPTHNRYVQNTPSTEMISGSLPHGRADKHNQLPEELKEQKHTDDQRHELQPVDIRSLDENQTKFRDEHNEITKTMKDLWIIQHQAGLEEKADNEQQLRRELSMVAQDNDAKHGDENSRLVAYQEDDSLKLQNENIQEYKELHEQIQTYFSSASEILDQTFKQELDRMAKDAYSETLRYIANLQSIFDFPGEKLQISQDHDMLDGSDWEYRTANTLHVTDDQFESFHAKVKQKLDRHRNEHEGKFTVDQVGTYSVSSQHEHNQEDNQQKMMKINEELTELLQTETTHIMKTNEQSLTQTKPILKTFSRRGYPVDD